MGKFTRKPKITGEVSIMEVLPSPSYSSLGICTRSRTLALHRSILGANDGSNATSCLQLRSRTLEKPRPPGSGGNAVVDSEKEANLRDQNGAGSNYRKNRAMRNVVMAEEVEDEEEDETEVASWDPLVNQEGGGEVDSSERNIRETTPCSLILDSELLITPGSTTRKSYSNASCIVKKNNTACRSIPTTHETEELFSGAERIQQQKFTEKYNFDLVNDCPLPGRYEWMALDC